MARTASSGGVGQPEPVHRWTRNGLKFGTADAVIQGDAHSNNPREKDQVRIEGAENEKEYDDLDYERGKQEPVDPFVLGIPVTIISLERLEAGDQKPNPANHAPY